MYHIPLTVTTISKRDKLGFSFDYRADLKELAKDISSETNPKKVLIVEDIVDSGETISHLLDYLKNLVGKEVVDRQVKTLCLIYNKKNEFKVRPTHHHLLHDGSWVEFFWEKK